MNKYGDVVDKIIAALEQCGPMTRTEICAEVGEDRMTISSVVSRLAKATKRKPKRVYITHYVYDMEGERRYPRAVYDLGDKEDARKPKASTKANRQRSDAKRRVINTCNSVFNLGLPRREYRL